MQQAQYGTAGITFAGPPETRLAIFQLTGGMTYPDLTDAASDHFNCEPSASAPAKPLWCHQYQAADQAGDGTPIVSYQIQADEVETTIWYLQAPCNAYGYAMGTPPFAPGDRVPCWWNRQSGRWEILAEPWRVWRFELQDALIPGGSATANLLECLDGSHYTVNEQVQITVWDALQGTFWGRARDDNGPGSQGYALYLADSNRWEILKLYDRARRANATVAAAMTADASEGMVDNVVPIDGGWSPVATTADTLVVANTMGWAAASGAVCKIEFNAAGGQWEFVNVAC